MKKLFCLILCIIIALPLCACETTQKIPDEDQIKNICQLTSIKCYFNNVAKGEKKKGTGFVHLLENDRKFWIEYEGMVEIGIDMKKTTMTINENNITITLPSADILNSKVEEKTLNEDSYTISKDSFWNKNKITVEEQQLAIDVAQEEMLNKVKENRTLFDKAEKEAKSLITNYINALGKASGITYNITWEKL